MLAKIQIRRDDSTLGLPELLGFAYGLGADRAELLMQHCGRDLNHEWLCFMESRQASGSTAFQLRVSQMSLQITEALERLHAIGFCHWDLKLDNICYLDGQYHLIDFAFAQRIHRQSPIKTFKGNSMFASVRKFAMNSRAAPLDDLESLLYLACFCLDGFYLPWLHDYISQQCTDHFILTRLQRARKCHKYLYQ